MVENACLRWYDAQPVLLIPSYSTRDSFIAEQCNIMVESYWLALSNPKFRELTCMSCDLYGPDEAASTCFLAAILECPETELRQIQECNRCMVNRLRCSPRIKRLRCWRFESIAEHCKACFGGPPCDYHPFVGCEHVY